VYCGHSDCMFKTHERGMHEVRKNRVNMPCGMPDGNPYYLCIKCGKSNRRLFASSWEDESCREYLQKQKELERLSSTIPARQSKFRNLSFDEVFADCRDPMEYLARRSVTINTHFGEVPEEWG